MTETGIVSTKMLIEITTEKLAEISEFGNDGVLLSNPGTKAKFPVCVMQPPLQTPIYMGRGWNLSITCEVWAATLTEAAGLFDKVKCKFLELNFMQNGNSPPVYDEITKKWRFGGYFEARWNAITNTLERNV